MARFFNRRDAGRELSRKLLKYANRSNVIALGLPRGGIPVAYEVAIELHAPLDVFLVRKLGLPGREELAIGAIASGGIQILNQDIIDAIGINQTMIDLVIKRESRELQRREEQYRGDRPAPDLYDRTVILIDDGLATGASMLAAVHGVRAQNPSQIVAAVPAAAPQAIDLLQPEADEIVYVIAPHMFEGVGKWYDDFSQTTDEEVRSLLEAANQYLHRE